MFSNGKADLPHKTSSLQIEKDDKFFSRLLSKENSICLPCFRITVAIPFVWESEPGTPKYTFSRETLPPLTPPPSFYINGSKTPIKKRSRSNLFRALFSRLNLKKTICSSSSSSSLSLSSWPSPSSSEIIPMAKLGRRRFWSSGSSFDFTGDDEEDDADSPTSTMCFSACRFASSDTGYRRSCK